MKDSISVAIPLFNRAEWISKTLDHILAQTVSVDEIVICDDGSTDSLDESLRPYGDKVKVVRIPNSGPAAARKVAIEESVGSWIALCDSDDYWAPDHIENFAKALQKYPSTNLFFSNFVTSERPESTKFGMAPSGWMEEVSEQYIDSTETIVKCADNILKAFLKYQACFPSCIVFDRDLYRSVGGIHSKVSRWASEDFHLTARLFAVANSVMSTEATVTINKHDNNFSREYIKNIEGEILVFSDILHNDLVPLRFRGPIKDKVSDLELQLFRNYYWSGQYEKARDVGLRIKKDNFCSRDWLRFVFSCFRLL